MTDDETEQRRIDTLWHDLDGVDLQKAKDSYDELHRSDEASRALDDYLWDHPSMIVLQSLRNERYRREVAGLPVMKPRD